MNDKRPSSTILVGGCFGVCIIYFLITSLFARLSGLRTSSRRWRTRSSSWGSFRWWSTPWWATGKVSRVCLHFSNQIVSTQETEERGQTSRLNTHSVPQSCVGARRYLPKAWPCWETPRTTRPCRGPCPSWRRWRIRWSNCTRSRQPVTSSSSQSCWPTTSACWVLCV